ncbi:MAG: hypothetical protein H7Y38_01055 [Armatimonadetes bacterium]|nr:hypothetical protein [Armatimonadota bacterium]
MPTDFLAHLPRLRRMVGDSAEPYNYGDAELLALCDEKALAYSRDLTSDTLTRVAIVVLTDELAVLRKRVDTRDRDAEKKYSQAVKATQDLIAQYQARLPIVTVQAVRSDVC